MALVDVALKVHEPANSVGEPSDGNQTWDIKQYLLSEDDPDYNERHALSGALEDWRLDVVSEPEALRSFFFSPFPLHFVLLPPYPYSQLGPSFQPNPALTRMYRFSRPGTRTD